MSGMCGDGVAEGYLSMERYAEGGYGFFFSSSFFSSSAGFVSGSVVAAGLSVRASVGGCMCDGSLSGMGTGVRSGGGGGSSTGPSHPSCSPLTYSFQVCLPRTRSPLAPGSDWMYIFSRMASIAASVSVSAAAGSLVPSPRFRRRRRICSAVPYLTSPSFLPSITS